MTYEKAGKSTICDIFTFIGVGVEKYESTLLGLINFFSRRKRDVLYKWSLPNISFYVLFFF